MQISLDKKSNIEYLEKEIGLHKFLPKSVLDAIKPKVLKKAIQQQFKKVKYFFFIFLNTTSKNCQKNNVANYAYVGHPISFEMKKNY